MRQGLSDRIYSKINQLAIAPQVSRNDVKYYRNFSTVPSKLSLAVKVEQFTLYYRNSAFEHLRFLYMGASCEGKLPALETFLTLFPDQNGFRPVIYFTRVTFIEKEGDIVFKVKGQHVEISKVNTVYEVYIWAAEKGATLKWYAQA